LHVAQLRALPRRLRFDTNAFLTHLSRQLDLPPVLFIAGPDRDSTLSEHEQRIRQYLGYDCT
jgi:hypothetical protein